MRISVHNVTKPNNLDRNAPVCNNILELAGNPYTVFTASNLSPDTSYYMYENAPWYIQVAIWYAKIPWYKKLFVGIMLLIFSIPLIVISGGGGLEIGAMLFELAKGVILGIGFWAIGTLANGGMLTWEGLGNAALDSFLMTSAFIFISTAFNAIKVLCRSQPVTTAELSDGVNQQTAVIGKMKDLNAYKLKPGEYKVADLLPDMGNAKANWTQNSSVLRRIMQSGQPIRDVSAVNGQLASNTGFLAMERNLLIDHGWIFSNGFWILGG